ISSPNESFTGTWNASGEEIVPATNNEHRQFTCPGGKLSEAVGAGQPKLFVNPMGESFVLKMAVAGAGEYGDWSNCLFPEGGAFLGHTFWNDEETPTGPFSGEITITKADLAQETTKAISPTHSQLPTGSCEAPNAGGSKFVAANECTSSFNWTGTVIIEPRCEHVTTGKGYSGLSATMKADLGSLYAKLKSEKACFHFTIGTRSRSEQEDLYDRWHAIADGAENKPPAQVEKELKKAGFAQQPEGWEPDGTAKGGPAMPGHSRHESSEAADITVVYPPKYEPDTARFHAAAASAGLCGPPASDKVHVELPYKKKGQTVATCHFG
ncbi:MAG TPA: hypothetical protein VKG62_01140, partial [Solirubrobacteraceae bacterium]|nr:hypothetical protein [Solirubrobacteraceae bacterium]